MRRQKLLALSMLLLGISASLKSQPWIYHSTKMKSATTNQFNYHEERAAFYEYWEGREVTRSRGYKPFKRWEHFMETRVDEKGQLNNADLWKAIEESTQQKAKGGAWTFVGPPTTPFFVQTSTKAGNGRLNTIRFHPTNPNKLYAGAPAGGLWVSEDKGENWHTTTDMLASIGISDIAISHKDTNQIFLATGDGDAGDTYSIGIVKSTDGGVNWELTSVNHNTTDFVSFRKILMHPVDADTMWATASNGIYMTKDAWQTFKIVAVGHFMDLEMHPTNPAILYATKNDDLNGASIHKSIDGGETFVQSNDGILNTSDVTRFEIAVTLDNPSLIYALSGNNRNSGFEGLYRSLDEGLNWEQVYGNSSEDLNLLGWENDGSDSGGQAWYDLALAVSPEDDSLIFVGGVNVWRSSNGGTSWTLSGLWYPTAEYNYVHADQHFFAYSPLDGNLYAANDGGLYYTADYGLSWTDITTNMGILQPYRLSTSALTEDMIICGNQDNGTFLMQNTDWFQVNGGDGMECIIDHSNDDVIYSSIYNGTIYKSTDRGITFDYISPAENGAWVTPYVMDPNDPNVLYIGYSDVYKTVDGGSSWDKIETGLKTELIRSIAIAPSNSKVVYYATLDKMYKSTESGYNPQSIQLPNLGNSSITSIAVSANDHNKVWLSISGYRSTFKVLESTNGGKTWNNKSTGLPHIPINFIVSRANSNHELYAGTDIGVYYIDASMEDWVKFGTDLPNVKVSELEISHSFNKLRAATYGRGIWEILLDEAQPLKADFQADLNFACYDSDIEFVFTGLNDYDSLVWESAAQMSFSNSQKDTVIMNFGNVGNFDVSLHHYKDGIKSTETKSEYIICSNTLDFELKPSKLNACSLSNFELEAIGPYEFSWAPETWLDQTTGPIVHTTPEDDIVYTVSASHGSCVSQKQIQIQILPDDICDADFLEIGTHGPFNNSCASKEETEPVPPIGTEDCSGQDGWCDGSHFVENSLWFKCLVPESGRLKIATSGFDTQLGIYSASTCGDLLNGNFEMIAANDDYPGNSDYSAESDILKDLTPQDTIWIQVDGTSGQSGNFILEISSPSSNNLSPIQKQELANIKVFPNPTKGILNIEFISPGETLASVVLFNGYGSMLAEETIQASNGHFTLEMDIESFPGLNILRINIGNKSYTRKVLVK